jgi:uncharacterized membrane protein
MIIIFVLIMLALPSVVTAAFRAAGSRLSKMAVFGGCLVLAPLVNYVFTHIADLIGMPATEFALMALEFISFLVFIPLGIVLLILNFIFGWKNNDDRPRGKKSRAYKRKNDITAQQKIASEQMDDAT